MNRSVKNGCRPRVAIVLPYVNAYRVKLLEILQSELADHEIDLLIYSGSPAGVDRRRNDEVTAGAFNRLRQHSIRFGTKMFVVKFLPSEILRFDMVVVEHAVKNLDTLLLILPPRSRRKVAIWGHGHTITKPRSRGEAALQTLMTRRADWYFAYTEGSAQRAIGEGAHVDHVTVLNNSTDTASIRSLRKKFNRATAGDQSSTWCALFVGAMDESKRIDFLIAAARLIYREDNRFRLLLVGDGPDKPLLRDCAREGWCVDLGRFSIEDNFEAIKDAQVVMMPGRVGLVAVDSFALGAPIITTTWPWHGPEFDYLTTHNSVVTKDSLEDYSGSVVELMRDHPRLQKLQDTCALDAETYTLENMASNFGRGIVRALSRETSDMK